jgi:hypothetical protein
MRVSFDFDNTLDHKTVQRYAAELIERGIEVWIVTSRFDCENYRKHYFTSYHGGELANKDLFDVAKELGIPEERIYFTNMMNKHHFFKDKDFIWHIDDDWIEVREIQKNTKTRGISYFNAPNWKSKCEKTLSRFIPQNDNH